MALVGEAFVIMWHDIAPEGDAEYNLWHTREHMPERIALPGFRRSRRGVNRALSRQIYFTLYEGDTLESFVSPEYLRSLNQPTAWTTRVAPSFRNFMRMSCATRHSEGDGVGGALSTFRAVLPEGADEAAAVEALRPVLRAIADRPAVSAVHVGAARPTFAGGDTREIELRPKMAEPPFDVVVIVEGIGLDPLVAEEAGIANDLAGAGLRDILPQSYDMAYLLQSEAA